MLRGGEPGGTGDLQARALIPFLEKHLPRKPQDHYLEHARRRRSESSQPHLHNGEPDGLTIGAVGAGLVVGPILGLTGTMYELGEAH
jgi:hypothetical protein